MSDRGNETRDRILDVAQAMVQEKGYNGVSFRDLAAAVEIKSASIHYYFPSKEDLAGALVARYRKFFDEGRAGLDRAVAAAAGSPVKKLEGYIALLRSAFRQTGRMCLCGVLAAEVSTLPESVAEGVRGFFRENEGWIAEVLSAGRKAGEMRVTGSPEQAAKAVFASLEGALMSAWIFGDEARIAAGGRWVMESVKAEG